MRHRPGTPFNSRSPKSSKLSPDPAVSSRTVCNTRISDGPANEATREPVTTARPPGLPGDRLDLAGVQTGTHVDVERLNGADDRPGAPHRAPGSVERCEEAVAGYLVDVHAVVRDGIARVRHVHAANGHRCTPARQAVSPPAPKGGGSSRQRDRRSPRPRPDAQLPSRKAHRVPRPSRDPSPARRCGTRRGSNRGRRPSAGEPPR